MIVPTSHGYRAICDECGTPMGLNAKTFDDAGREAKVLGWTEHPIEERKRVDYKYLCAACSRPSSPKNGQP